jgi:hypothetical protein
MHLVGYLYEDYHDARSLEHKVRILIAQSGTQDKMLESIIKLFQFLK